MKRIISILIIFSLIFTVIPTTTAFAAIKLNETALTLDEGSQYQLKLTGTTKTIKWTSSNLKIVKVSSQGKLTAIKEGKAIITAKVSNKKYKCNVTVNDVLTEKEAAQQITYESAETAQGLVLIFNNGNKKTITINATVTYYDENGDILSKEDNRILSFQSEHKSVLTFPSPDSYDNYEITFTVDLSCDFSFPSLLSSIQLDVNKTDNIITAKLTNNTKFTCCTPITILFYKNGSIVGYDDKIDYFIHAGESCIIEFSNPHDNTSEISYDDYKVILNAAYAC